VVPIPPHKKSTDATDLTNEVLEQKRLEPFGLLDRSSPMSIPIDLAREVKRSLSRSAPPEQTRVVVFYQMDKMRQASTDALLKLIEEPPDNTVIVLTAPKPEVLLPTIQSRSQLIRLDRLPEAFVAGYLHENYDLTPERSKLLWKLTNGILGQAIELARKDDPEETSLRAVGLMLFRTLCTELTPVAISRVYELVNFSDQSEIKEHIRLWQSLIRDCAYFAHTGDEDGVVNIDFLSEIKHLSVHFSNSASVTHMVGTINNTLADLTRNVHTGTSLLALALGLRSEVNCPTGEAV